MCFCKKFALYWVITAGTQLQGTAGPIDPFKLDTTPYMADPQLYNVFYQVKKAT
jgi:hypothetical protein